MNTRGAPICPRLGAAVDFLVEYEDMYEVAKWITENCAYDRIYLYGKDRPIHVSHGPAESRGISNVSKWQAANPSPTIAVKRSPRTEPNSGVNSAYRNRLQPESDRGGQSAQMIARCRMRRPTDSIPRPPLRKWLQQTRLNKNE